MGENGKPRLFTDRRLLALSAGNFTVGAGAYIVTGILPQMAADMGGSVAALGQTVTAFAVAVGLGAPLLAGPTSSIDRKRLLSFGLLLFAAGQIVSSLASDYVTLMAARFASGLGAALFSPHALGAAALLAPPEARGRAVSMVFVGFTAATAFGVPIGTMLADLVGWRATLASIGVLALLALVAVRRYMPTGLFGQRIDGRAWRQIFTTPLLLLILLVTLAQVLGKSVLGTYIAPVLLSSIGATGALIGLLLLVNGACAVIGNVLAGQQIDRRGAALTANVLMVGVGLSLAAFPLSHYGLLASAILMAAWGFCSFAITGAQQVRLIDASPSLSSATLPLNATATYVGLALGAIVGGLALPAFGYDWLGPIGALFLLFAIALSKLTKRYSTIAK